MTPTFTKSLSFLNRVNILIFLKNKQSSGTFELSENVRFMGVFGKSKSASADQRGCLRVDDTLTDRRPITSRLNSPIWSIDPFKVNAAILPGVQNYWGERAVKHKLQMATPLNNLLLCQNTLAVR